MIPQFRSPITSVLAPILVAGCLTITVTAQSAPDLPDASRVTPTELTTIHVPEGFVAEKLYEVPEEPQGSWVTLTPSADGGLITSDQYGSFYKITLPTEHAPIRVQRLEIDLGMAQGLLEAFDSLYAVVNGGTRSGLYRARDLDRDGRYEDVKRIVEFAGEGEHGPHAVIRSPDGEWLYVCAGNMTKLPKLTASLVPRVWQEDILIDRLWDPQGHAVGIMAPGGWICRVKPDGSRCELVAIGFRNEYDIAFHPDGQLFTFDADMEWDMGTSWYRPTRILHVIPGVDFGWRGGTGKWPEYQIDTLPAVVNVGPGSPTGIAFGTFARFPERYRQALFAGDWSHGRIYAVHLSQQGASYRGEVQTFATAAALPVTDIVIHPADGAMYFTTGGRRLASGLYRVRYVGKPVDPTGGDSHESPAPAPLRGSPVLAFETAEFGLRPAAERLSEIWPWLADRDRYVRYRARLALEALPVETWQSQALAETQSTPALEAMIALIRHAAPNALHSVMQRLDAIAWEPLDHHDKLALLRAYGLALLRLGPADAQIKQSIASRFEAHFPSGDPILDRELSRLLASVRARGFVKAAIQQLPSLGSAEEKSHYLLVLSVCAEVMSTDELDVFFAQLTETKRSGGGKSYGGYMDAIGQRVMEQLPPEARASLAARAEQLVRVDEQPEDSIQGTKFVRAWTIDELSRLAERPLIDCDLRNGRRVFSKANCITCHRIQNQGGVQGPDLTTVGARIAPHDLVLTIAQPSRAISDQYALYRFETQDGSEVQGRIVDLSDDRWVIGTDMLHPGQREIVKISEVTSVRRVDVSAMPEGLLNVLTEQEILDLLAFLVAQR